MPVSHRRWSEEEISKLKSMAGKVPVDQIAAELGAKRGCPHGGGWKTKAVLAL